MVSLDLELKRTDIHEYSQEANAGQKRFVRAEAEIIEVWYRRLGWHIGNMPFVKNEKGRYESQDFD